MYVITDSQTLKLFLPFLQEHVPIILLNCDRIQQPVSDIGKETT